MSKLQLFVSATFVLIFISLPDPAQGSPQREVPESKITEPDSPVPPPDDNLSVAQPPKLKAPPPPSEPRYYRARQALTARLGIITDPDSHELKRQLWGFEYLFPGFLTPKVEGGGDIQEGGRGHVHAGYRWYWREKEYFRPSVKAAFDHLLVASEGMGTLVKWENFNLRGGATLEYVVWNPYSVRLEYDILLGPKEIGQIVTLGLSHGW